MVGEIFGDGDIGTDCIGLLIVFITQRELNGQIPVARNADSIFLRV